MKSTTKRSGTKAKSTRKAQDLAPRTVPPTKAGAVRGGIHFTKKVVSSKLMS